ncbi:MAG: purine-nucleoside phosphorylase, partial [Acidobacteria bacterium]|nr:purine-nucleoside phosphorylase [Acidobacteriota bacterium]
MGSAGTFERVDAAAEVIRRHCGDVPKAALVLGSGLGDFADTLAGAVTMPYAELPHWPAPKVVGHAGRLVIGTVAGKRVAALAGRVHAYEGHPLSTVA